MPPAHQEPSSSPPPTFRIGSIPIFGKLILAPMDGVSDPPFRLITRRLGSAFSLSEFINTLDFSVQKHFQQSRFAFQPQERPFGIQLLDNDPQRMAESAMRWGSLSRSWIPKGRSCSWKAKRLC